VNNEDCLYCDIWGTWDVARYRSDNGYFFGREIASETSVAETEVTR
jgi:UDP-N-acetyl-D-mannosaminuronic acid dehydrogenase